MNLVISLPTILLSLLVLFSLWVVFQIKDIIITIFVAVLLSMALMPLINELTKRKIKRGIAAALVYAVFLALLILILSFGISPLVEQTTLFLSQLPKILDTILTHPFVEPVSKQIIESLTGQLSAASGSLVKITIDVFSSLFSLMTMVFISFYFSLEFESIQEKFLMLFPDTKIREKIKQVVLESEAKIGGWVRGEMILVLIIGVMTYVGLSLLRVNYALPLAVIAGILEIIPMIGPLISAVPAVLVGFAASPILGLGVVALFVLVQQFENTIVVPRVMKKAIGLDPILTMLTILVGGRLFGVMGALLSVPVTLVVIIVLKHFYYSRG